MAVFLNLDAAPGCSPAGLPGHATTSSRALMSKEPNRHQLSSRLAYQAHTPAFLQRLQGRINGTGRDDEDDDEYEYDGSGRPPIPKRPAIPERPGDDPGSAEEDDGDEKPQIVVLREGKHLSEREVENERRKGELVLRGSTTT